MKNTNELNKKPVAMMTGEELGQIIDERLEALVDKVAKRCQERLYYGIDGIAQLFGCSTTTANRIKSSGIIDDAVIQIGRQIIIEGNHALELAREASKKAKDEGTILEI